jgi:outer membrane protein TolC
MFRIWFVVLLVIVMVTGCVTAKSVQIARDRSENALSASSLPTAAHAVQLVSHNEPVAAQAVVHTAPQPAFDQLPEPESLRPSSDPLAPTGVLDIDRLVADVVARNPSVEAMISAWQAAAQRYPQVIALDDPILDVSVGPGSWGSSEVESAYMVMASQKIPWPGKRQLRGAIANAEANAAAIQIEDVELQLAEKTRLAFYDYFTAHRQLALNSINVKNTNEFRESAEAKLQANLVPQQDVLQSELELAKLDRRRNELLRQFNVAAARLNTPLHRDAFHPLPPPPDQLEDLEVIPTLEELRDGALERRPDLVSLGAQIQANEATLALAWREFYPDLEVYAKYDAFWQEHPLRSAVGVNVNVPLNKSKRCAAVNEAQLRLAQLRAQYERLVDEITYELHTNYESLLEAQRTAELFDKRLIPTAERNIELARAGYTTGSIDFLRLIEAQRQLIELHEEQAVRRVQAREAVVRRIEPAPERVRPAMGRGAVEELPRHLDRPEEEPRHAQQELEVRAVEDAVELAVVPRAHDRPEEERDVGHVDGQQLRHEGQHAIGPREGQRDGLVHGPAIRHLVDRDVRSPEEEVRRRAARPRDQRGELEAPAGTIVRDDASLHVP